MGLCEWREHSKANKREWKEGKANHWDQLQTPTYPDHAVDKESCGKSAERRKMRGAIDRRGIMRIPEVPASLGIQFVHLCLLSYEQK